MPAGNKSHNIPEIFFLQFNYREISITIHTEIFSDRRPLPATRIRPEKPENNRSTRNHLNDDQEEP